MTRKYSATSDVLKSGSGYKIDDCAATEVSGNSRFGMVSFPGVRTNVLQGTVHDETAYYAMEGISGNAGLFANAESLCRILTAYMRPRHGVASGATLISQEVLDTMLQPTRLPGVGAEAGSTTSTGETVKFGMPWYLEIAEDGAMTEFWMNGFTRCYAGILPELNIAVVYLTNSIHSPLVFTTDDPAEQDLEHARFGGNRYAAANQGILFQ